MPTIQAFISYVHEDAKHRGIVLQFAQLLRTHGVDARLDQFVEHQVVDWPTWMHEEITRADVVLCVASPSYKPRTEGHVEPPEGRGARWEGAILRDWIYEGLRDAGRRVIGVVLPGGDATDLPYFLFPVSNTYFTVPALDADGLEGLMRRLTNQPGAVPNTLGQVPVLPARDRLVQLTRADFALPTAVSLTELISRSDHRWDSTLWEHPNPVLETPIGVDADGRTVLIDLRTDGPNLAVAGTTGSGKTEAIFTAMLGLAARNSPRHLLIIAVTGKGAGFPFHVLDGLPHFRSTYSVEEANFSDVIEVIKKEMDDRRRRLVVEGRQDMDELWATARPDAAVAPPPYILLVAEEWSYLEYDNPEVVHEIRRLAHQGRALGIQVIVGAQQPQTLTNFPAHIRLALRMIDAHEASDFAHIPITVPQIRGRAVLVRDGDHRPIQIAMSRTEELREFVNQMRIAVGWQPR